MMDEVKISISRTRETISSCNACNARTFQVDDPIAIGKYISILYDVRIGSAITRLCPDCIQVLRSKLESIQ